jgi:uncharacterized protein (TIGR02147 family)
MNNLNAYHDYRVYLRDWMRFKQEKQPEWTWRVVSEKLGMETAAFFRICQGERHLPLKFLPIVVQLLGLIDQEAEEFKLLVEYGRAKRETLKQALRTQLLLLRSGEEQSAGSDVDLRYFEHWLHPVVFSVLHTQKFAGNQELVARELCRLLKPKISEREVVQSLDLLLDMGLVQHKDGCWEPLDINPNARIGWTDGRVRSFQRACLDLAAHALETQSKAERTINTLTLHLTHGAKESIENEICLFRERVKGIVESDAGAETVMQLNVQFFALMESPGDKT